MNKTILVLMMAVSLTTSYFPVSENVVVKAEESTSYDYEDEQGVRYHQSQMGGGAAVVSYGAQLKSEIVIPATVTIGGSALNVTSIIDGAFADCKTLTGITVSGNTAIAGGAFSGCSNLKKIQAAGYDVDDNLNIYSDGGKTLVHASPVTDHLEINSGVQSIGDGACKNQLSYTDITIPDGVTSIGDSAFSGCKNMKSITIPNSTTAIGTEAFCETGLTSCELPDSLEMISESLFKDCSALSTVSIPDTVTEIGLQAFASCSSLKQISIPSGVTSIGDLAFYQCTLLKDFSIDSANQEYVYEKGCIFTKDKTTLVEVLPWAEQIDLPDTVVEILNDACLDCTQLTQVNLGNTVNTIGSCAFQNCSKLKEIYFPDSVNQLGTYAFAGCTALSKVRISPNLGAIDDFAFSGCSSLVSVNIPDGVEAIGNSAFENCSQLKQIAVSDSVTEIAGMDDVSDVGKTEDTVFQGCNSEFTIFGTQGSFIENYASAFGLPFSDELDSVQIQEAEKTANETVDAADQTQQEEVTVTEDKNTEENSGDEEENDGEENNGEDNEEDTEDVSVGTILNSTKNKCKIKVTSDNGNTKTASYAKTTAKKGTVVIPQKVTVKKVSYKISSIEKNAFSGYKKVKKIVIKSTSIKKIAKNAFQGVSKKAVITVPFSKKAAYTKLLKKAGCKAIVK